MKAKKSFLTGLLFIGGTVTLLLAGIRYSSLSEVPKAIPSVKPISPVTVVVEPKIVKAVPPKFEKTQGVEPARCVFKTAFEGEGIDKGFYYKIPGKVVAVMDKALDWMKDAQLNDGGWGAGYSSRQDIRDPHAVQSDPATTAMVAMSLLRCGNTLEEGQYSKNLNRALNFLMKSVEESPENSSNITDLNGTQPQVKLGQNIDVVLTCQFLTNMLDQLEQNPQLKSRVKKDINKCVAKIEKGNNADGSFHGSGWAGVLQSSFASNALESARDNGIAVDEEILENSKNYQKQNINPDSKAVTTESAAGVVLYSVSGSTRASAKEAGEARKKLEKAKQEGKVKKDQDVSVENLKKAGMNDSDALKYTTAYRINQSAKQLAQDDNVMSGFGNNGGEEFLSYLQTGEGLIIGNDDSWQNWYDKMSGRLLQIQNNDGSWSGHHCITSPVFCTATCLLILSVNNDIDRLTREAKSKN